MAVSKIKALTFDVFGTVVDWRSTIIDEVTQLAQKKEFTVDAARFADDWRAGYQPAMHRVRTGDLPWLNIDALHRVILDDLLDLHEIRGLSESEKVHLNYVWHRLKPWADVPSGLERLRQSFTIATLSNGNVALLTNMAKNADLRWDCILSAELSNHYKPDPEVYLKAAQLLGISPEETMMVAAHNSDLKGAKNVGFQTAFIYRPQEYGPTQTTDLEPGEHADFAAKDFIDLATQLETHTTYPPCP